MKLGVLFKKTMKRIGSGAPGNSLRVLAFRLAGYSIGKDVWIGTGLVVVDDREGEQTLSIGDRAAIAPRATIILQSYPNNSRIRDAAPTRNASVRIGDDAWIGACAIILPGVSVGPASVVGAGSVVTKDVAEDSVFVGNPARCLRAAVSGSRFDAEIKFRRSLKRRNSEMVHAINSIDSIDAMETLDAIDKAEGGSAG
jgi:serine acetyltransferase